MSASQTQLPAYLRPLLDQHPAHLAQGIRRRDLAYACYLYFGLMLAIAFLLNWLPTGSWLYGWFADRFGATVLFGFLPAGIVAVGSTFHLRRDPPLIILAVSTAGVPAVLWATGRGSVAGAGAGVYFGVFTLLALALPLRWFLGLRRRLVEAGRQG